MQSDVVSELHQKQDSSEEMKVELHSMDTSLREVETKKQAVSH